MRFIENTDVILDIPEKYREKRQIIIEAMDRAIESVHPETVIPEYVRIEENIINIGGRRIKKKGRIALFGMGKAAYHMGKAIQGILGNLIDTGLIISIKKDTVGNIRFLKGSHPFPDERTVEYTEDAIEMAETLGDRDIAIVLIGGGGSSMFCLPSPGISVEEIRWVTEELMKLGADIWELNLVRRSISLVKGGGFAGYIRPAKIFSLIISDVIDNHLPSIASGPTVYVGYEGNKAENILKKYGLWERLSPEFKSAVKSEKKREDGDMSLIIADNRKAVNHASIVLTSYGIDHHIFYSLRSNVEELSNHIISLRTSSILGGESTAEVRGNGKGGRNQELVLRAIAGGFSGTIAAIGTDGIDGNSRYAGAIADDFLLELSRKSGLSMEKFLENSDSSSFFESVKSAIYTGYTGTNVADLIIALL